MKNILNIQAGNMIWWHASSQIHSFGESTSRKSLKSRKTRKMRKSWKSSRKLRNGKRMKIFEVSRQKMKKWRTFSISKLGKWFDDMLAARNIASASRQVRNRKLSEIRVGSWEMEKDENLWSIKTKQNKWRIFSISKLGKWFEDMLAARNIASASRTRGNLADSAEIGNRR